MGRYLNPTGKQGKYKTTDPIYGTLDKGEVDAGVSSGAYVLMEREVHAKIDGKLQAFADRRYMPAGVVEEKEKRGWYRVDLSASEKSATIVTKKGYGAGKSGPVSE